jgi:hypothetical protein
VIVEVEGAPGEERPPVGAPVVVELRDTTYQDIKHPVLVAAHGQVARGDGPLAILDLDYVRGSAQSVTAWAHVDADGDGRVSRGDYVTTAAYPVTDPTSLRVTVRRVG